VDELQSGDGTDFPATVLPSGFESDGRQLLQVTVCDIPKYKRAETKLTELFEEFKTVMYSPDALVYVADMKTCEILLLNQCCRKI